MGAIEYIKLRFWNPSAHAFDIFNDLGEVNPLACFTDSSEEGGHCGYVAGSGFELPRGAETLSGTLTISDWDTTSCTHLNALLYSGGELVQTVDLSPTTTWCGGTPKPAKLVFDLRITVPEPIPYKHTYVKFVVTDQPGYFKTPRKFRFDSWDLLVGDSPPVGNVVHVDIVGNVSSTGVIETTGSVISSYIETNNMRAAEGIETASLIADGNVYSPDIRCDFLKVKDATITNGLTVAGINASGDVACKNVISVGGSVNCSYVRVNVDRSQATEWDIYTTKITGGKGDDSQLVIKPFAVETAGVYLKSTGGGWSTFSDKRLKKNVEPVGNALDSLCRLNPVKFEWKGATSRTAPTHGFIAQEVAQVFPEFVSPAPDVGDITGLLGINYDDFSVVSVKAIQELAKISDEMKDRIASMEERMNALEMGKTC